MRYMTMTELVSELRAETGISQNVAHGLASLDAQRALLRRVQEEIYLGHDWPHLKSEWTKTVSGRYATLPDNIEFTGIDSVWTRGPNGKWQPVHYGITPFDYNEKDPDTETGDTILRWQIYYQPDGDVSNRMFESWPVPNGAKELLFRGRRALLELDDEGVNLSTVDGPLIVLFAAAEILAKQKDEGAPLKLQKGMDRLKWLKSRLLGPETRQANFAGGSPRQLAIPGLDYMPRRGG